MPVFDLVASEYDQWYRTPIGSLVHEIEREIVYDLLAPMPGKRLLDFGCGTGNYTVELAQMGLQATGVDIAAQMLAVARQKAQAAGVAIDLRQEDITRIELAPGSFDLAVSVTALEFFPDPAAALSKVYHSLAAPGRMVVGVIGGQSPWSDYYQAKAKADPQSLFRHARFYTAAELLALFPGVQGRARQGLYFPPGLEQFDREQLLAQEREAQAENRPGAGFACALWEK